MKAIIAIVGIILLGGVGVGVYKASTMFNFDDVFSKKAEVEVQKGVGNMHDKLEDTLKDVKKTVEDTTKTVVNSGTAIASGLIASGKAMAQQYVEDQTKKLQKQAEDKVKEELHKKVDSLFTGKK